MGMNEEIMEIIDLTNKPQLKGYCNITFYTFVQANFADECIEARFPLLAEHFSEINCINEDDE